MPSVNTRLMSGLGLLVLGIVAAVLSVLALRSTGGIVAEPAPPLPSPTETQTYGPPSSLPPSEPVEEPTSEAPEPDVSETPTDGFTVVVIGDSHSIGDETWLEMAASELGWGQVVNLSSPGRGYLAMPRSCDFDPCATFGGSIEPIAEADPDLVITFGGVADGDFSITDAATTYYTSLRDAMPDAEIVGIAPVTTADDAAYWLTLHARSINSALGSVDGIFVDPGQPGVGDGEVLSPDAQAAIADAVVDALT